MPSARVPPAPAPTSESPSGRPADEPRPVAVSDDPVVAGAARLAGGRLGRHAAGGGLVRRPLLVLVPLSLVATAVAWALKAPCRDGWGGPGRGDAYQYTHLCYTDVYALWFAERLDAGALPYLEHPVEYPPLLGAAMALPMLLVRALGGGATAFFDATAVLLGIAAAVTVATTAGLAGRRRWDAALVAVAPALLLHAVTNWDLLATALAGGGLLAWARRRPVLAGVLLGLATVTKLYPAALLVPLLVVAWRAGRLRAGVQAAVAAGVAAAAVAVPTFLVSPAFDLGAHPPAVAGPSPLDALRDGGVGAFVDALSPVREDGAVSGAWRFVQLSSERGADWDSPWFHLGRAFPDVTVLSDPSALNLLTSGLALAVLAGVVALAVLAPRRPRVPQLAFLLVAGVLVTAKVFSPQFTLWLLPLAVLALPRWRPLLLWQATEVVLLVARMWMFAGQTEGVDGLPVETFGLAVLVRNGALLALVALVVRDVLRPEHDLVRVGGDDDPAGGPVDGAPDARGPRAGHAPADAAPLPSTRPVV